MKDYVIGSGNEKEFIEMGERLGYTELVFISNTDISKIKSKIKLSSSRRILKSNYQKDRGIIESKSADIIYDFEQIAKKDGYTFPSSGLNQVLVKMMKEKKVNYGLSFSQLLNASKEGKARIIGRLMQNIKLCKKYKVPVVIASFAKSPYEMRDPRDLISFAKSLGMHDYR